jgi:hypothetical protein
MDEVWEWLLIGMALAFLIAVEHFSYRSHKRQLMWVVGFAGITMMVWFKGAQYLWTWMLALVWLGVLFWLDHRLVVAEAPPNAGRKPDDEGPRSGVS